MTDLTDHFPPEIAGLPPFSGPLNARRLAASGCEVLFAAYPAGTEIDSHSHPTANAGVVTTGQLRLTQADVETAYEVGDWYRIPPDGPHIARFDRPTAIIEFWFVRESPA